MGQTQGLPERLDSQHEAALPNLIKSGYQVTSPRTPQYNCIAYAGADTTKKWDCGGLPRPGYYWPPGATRGASIEALVSAFQCIGFEFCNSNDCETGYERVALYVDKEGKWTHAARQLADGNWSSKLGDCEDIRHPTPEALSNGVYGRVIHYMRRTLGEGAMNKKKSQSNQNKMMKR